MTRGLALRSFTSLRLDNIIEYLPAVVTAGLKDSSPYVRKTAVMATVKLHRLAPGSLAEADMLSALYNMLRDRDAQVASNCICALSEILQRQGGMAISKPIIHHLLNRMKDFNEWAQCTVLEVLARYQPESQQETFDIMNLLEERLRHSNSAVVLGATKVFLNLTSSMPTVHAQVYMRLKAPMLTLMTGGIFEQVYTPATPSVQAPATRSCPFRPLLATFPRACALPSQGYVCLKHIALLTTRAPAIFGSDFKHFYCRYNDPACVKLLKLEILTTLADLSNIAEAVEEVAEYVIDPDMAVARGAVKAIGQMGVNVPDCAGMVVEALMKFLEVDIDFVCAEAIVCMQSLLRKYPAVSDRIIQGIGAFLKSVEESEAKVALLWMLAEYGHVIPEAPYLLEPAIENFAEEASQEVRLELLAAAAKLFLRRPAEMQAMLGRLFEVAISDASFTDVHDRAMLYYRMLEFDVNEALRVLSRAAQVDGPFVEEAASELQDRIFEEFNTVRPSQHSHSPGSLSLTSVSFPCSSLLLPRTSHLLRVALMRAVRLARSRSA